MKKEKNKTEYIRVDVYSLPSNVKTKLRCFIDIPLDKIAPLLEYLLTYGKSVGKNPPPIKK